MPAYSVENPIAGATIAYIGKKIIVKMNDPGMAGIHHVVKSCAGPP